MLSCEREEAVQKSIEPGGGQARGQGEREEDGEGIGAHGGEIAESASETAMSNGLRRVEMTAEMAVFEREVGGDADFIAGTGAKDSAVVADAGDQRGGARGRGAAADGFDEGEFAGDAGAFHG